MKRISAFVLLAGWWLGACAFGATAVLKEASQYEARGDFAAASALLRKAMDEPVLSSGDRKTLEFEADRLERIKKDFPYTADDLFAALQKAVRGLTHPEFDSWVSEGRFDSREIDGHRRFMAASVSNLFFRYPDLNSRRVVPQPDNTPEIQRRHLELCEAIEKAARVEKKPYVLPKYFEMTMRISVFTNAVPGGQTVSAWLPIPREYPFQTGFEILSSSAPIKHLDSPHSSARSAYLEQKARPNGSAEFKLQYLTKTYGVRFDIKPETITAEPAANTQLAEFTREAPHVVFTPQIRKLAETIAGKESNPALKAKRFYDWIAANIKYSYSIEYSTIPNISEYCRGHGYGDCGEEALLFISLCRLNGIPARWQSGWNTFPGGKDIHDWTEIYLPPYGWVPVDPYMGIYAMRYATALTPAERQELRDFYFGGLDQYRMAANSDHSQALNPPKKSMRSDDVDFQRGEVEYGTNNVYFDQYSYRLEVRELKPPRTRME